jgi:tRNA threonylcarbamoyladenosine biosynthesis protein TsaE
MGTGLEIVSHSADQTQRLGERLGRLLQPGDVVCLQGDLGSGKTCLTQGIARGLGVGQSVTSPTFIIINEYALPGAALKLRHIDLYRIARLAEARALGLEDYLNGDDICVVEWAERVLELLPAERLWVTLRYVNDTQRELRFGATGKRYTDLLERLRQEAAA